MAQSEGAEVSQQAAPNLFAQLTDHLLAELDRLQCDGTLNLTRAGLEAICPERAASGMEFIATQFRPRCDCQALRAINGVPMNGEHLA